MPFCPWRLQRPRRRQPPPPHPRRSPGTAPGRAGFPFSSLAPALFIAMVILTYCLQFLLLFAVGVSKSLLLSSPPGASEPLLSLFFYFSAPHGPRGPKIIGALERGGSRPHGYRAPRGDEGVGGGRCNGLRGGGGSPSAAAGS